MNIAQAKCIPLEKYLEHKGHLPKSSKRGGRELWYHSPIRDDDKNPSFKVDTIKNLWYDHGVSDGGNIIKLVREMCACDVRDALEHLEQTRLYSPALPNPSTSAWAPRSAASEKRSVEGEKEKSSSLELISQGPLKHPALLQYLEKRGIDLEIARKNLSEISFKAPERRGNYFGVGYPSGTGFEVRNALFKGFVGTSKSVTFHDCPNSTKLMIFEGFLDFLSYLSLKKLADPECAVLVLNSTNLWRQALPYLQNDRFEQVVLFLDNDKAGDAVTRKLFENVDDSSKLADMRVRYADYEDLNAWWLRKRS